MDKLVHELKTDPEVFQAIFDGLKTYEIRKADRDFKVGDTLRLRETSHTGAEMARGEPLVYTGRECSATITHILRGPIYGLANGWAILSIALLRHIAALEAREPADTTPDAALLADAWHCVANSQRWLDTQATEREVLNRLATALRESRAREVAVGTHECPHAAAIKDRIERQKTLPEGTYADQRDDTDKDCGYLLNKTYEMRREINSLKAQRDASVARAERAEPYRNALEQRMICANLEPLLTGNADADLMRFVFHDREIALSPEAGVIAELRERAEQAEAQLALCAENTAAADLAQEVECLKAEKEALREALGKIAARDTGYDRKKVDNLINSDNGDEVAEGAEMGEAHTCANIARAALALGGEVPNG